MNQYENLRFALETENFNFDENGIEIKTDGDLKLFCVKKEIVESGNVLTELQNECNGVIINATNNKIVAACQKRFMKISSQEQFQELCDNNSCWNPETEYCEDGTVIRLYNHLGYWRTATTRCIRGNKSFWSSDRTFEDMFFSLFNNDDFCTLNPCYTYVFILLHSDNRIVISHKKSKIIFVCKIQNDYSGETDSADCFDGRYDSIQKIELDECSEPHCHYVLESLFDMNKKGILVKFGNNVYQYNFKFYDFVKDIRGNVPQIRNRYIELFNDDYNKYYLKEYFKEYKQTFDDVENIVSRIIKEIHYLYIKSHVRHEITVDNTHKYYRTLIQLHGQFKKNHTVITEMIVRDKIKTIPNNVLKRLINSIDNK